MPSGDYSTNGKRLVRLPDQRIVGSLEGVTFTKVVTGSKHMLRQPRAWAVDAEAFDRQVKPMASLFRVKDTETGTVYEVSVDYFDEHKGELERGFGRQYFLPLGEWKAEGNGGGPRQLAFVFAGAPDA